MRKNWRMLSAKLIARDLSRKFDGMPPQMQVAARWVLDHPVDVALLSMRDQARRAGVPPVTLTRLAQRLGFTGFNDVRKQFAASVRHGSESFHGRAEELIARRAQQGEGALAQDVFAALSQHCQRLAAPENIAGFTEAADRLAAGERTFCIGLRSSYPVAYLFHYVRALVSANSVLVDGAGGTGVDALRTIGAEDVVLAVSVTPYTRLTVEAVRFARSRSAGVVAITDSALSPLARLSDTVIVVGTQTPSFFHTMAPAFVAVECLAALVAARKGPGALSALAESEDQLAAFDTYVAPARKRHRP